MRDETLEIDKKIKKPFAENIELIYNHFSRYSDAIEKMNINKEDHIIDYGCGNGYGSWIMSNYANSIMGIDINEKNILFAKKNFEKYGLTYHKPDQEFPYINTEIKYKIVCIECIEHMEQKRQIVFLETAIIIGKEIYLTFPVGNNKKSLYNKYHICEPSINFIYNQLRDTFTSINIGVSLRKDSFGKTGEYCILYAK